MIDGKPYIAQTTFRSTANNVEIVIPVPQDADSPKFKTTIGEKNNSPVKLAMLLNFYKLIDHHR